MSDFVAILMLCTCISITSSITVNTDYGPIEGFVEGELNKFLGIPFAKPPINDLRFASPEEPESWTEPLSATGPYVNACLQACDGEAPFCPVIQSEDCLYLNIWSPMDAEYEKTNYTVMVWIYGGSYNSGWSTFILYDPTSFINYIDDIIIVTLNYRIGILGWLYDNMYDTGVDGNFGEQDIQLALSWINKNIQYFGGNGDNIIIWGESAGANSVALELLYNDADYIAGGIMESPPLSTELRDPTTWYDVAYQFSNLIGCINETNINSTIDDDADTLLDCWRSVDAEYILSVQNDNGEVFSADWGNDLLWSPTVGTDMIPNQIVTEFKYNNIETAPFIIGTNKDEMFLFINDSQKDTFSYFELQNDTTKTFNEYITDLIFDQYNISETESMTESYLYDYATILNDQWICSVRNILINTPNITNKYYYNFNVIDEAFYESVIWPDNPACWDRVCHFTEVFYVFLAEAFLEEDLFDNNTICIGEQMQVFWSNFAKTLDPTNGINEMHSWEMFQNENVLIFNATSDFESTSINNDYYDNLCEFWDYIGYAGDYINDDEITSTLTPSQRPAEKDLTMVLQALLIILAVLITFGFGLFIYFKCCARRKHEQGPTNYVEMH